MFEYVVLSISGERGRNQVSAIRKEWSVKNESHCSLGEAPFCKDEKQDGIKRGNNIIGKFQVYFSKNGGNLRGTGKLRGRGYKC